MKAFKLLLKILAGIIVLLVILAVAGYFALTRWINPNDFKPEIVSMVKQETGRDLTLTGDLSWDFFPNIGLHMGAAALSNPSGFSQPTFAAVNSVDLSLNWNALLHGTVAINQITVNGLQVFLITDGNRNNWTFTLPSAPASTSTASEAASGAALNLMLEDININNGTLTYDDLASKTHYALNNVTIALPQFSLTSPMNVQISGDVDSDNLAGNIKLNTLFFYDMNKNMLSLDNTALNTHFTYTNDDNQETPIVLTSSGKVVVDLSRELADLTGVSFSLNQSLSGTTAVKLSNFSHLNYSGVLNIPQFSLGNVLSSFNKSVPSFPNQDQFAKMSLQTNFAGGLNALDLTNLQLGLGNTVIQGSLALNSFAPFRMSENLTANQLDLADFMNLDGARLPMQNLALNGSLSLKGFGPYEMPATLNGSQQLSIQDITLKGFDLGALINQIDVIVDNTLNLTKVADAYASIQSQLTQFESGQGPMNANNGKQTDFGNLTAQIKINDGVVTTPSLVLAGPLVKVTGQGSIDLNQKKMDYHLNGQVLASSHHVIKTLNIPYNISGPFSNLQQGVDTPAITQQIVQFAMQKIGESLTNAVKNAITAPGGVVSGVGKGTADIVGGVAQGAGDVVSGVAKGVAGALGSIFGKQGS